MALSSVAGIIDRDGFFRVVVTQRWRLRHHVKKGERLFVVPGYLKKEPVPWGEIPVMIRRVELFVEWWLTTRNDPLTLRDAAIQNYLRNPNAYHNLEPTGFHYPGLFELKAAA